MIKPVHWHHCRGLQSGTIYVTHSQLKLLKLLDLRDLGIIVHVVECSEKTKVLCLNNKVNLCLYAQVRFSHDTTYDFL